MITAPADFADWLSPILVKELRQGMRRRIFVISFILLQVAMVFLAVASLAAASSANETEEYSVIFWIIVGLPLMVTMPASGMTAVGAERRAGTLELMFLTRLSARRIFLGKWFAIVTQTTLLVTAVVPYVVLRYYLGGVDLSVELTVLGALLLGSAVLSGISVGLSPLPALMVRALASVAGFFVLMSGAGMLAALTTRGMFGAHGGGVSGWEPWLLFAIFGGLIFSLMMEFGSSRIAPPSENHSTPVRLIGLVGLATSAGFVLVKADQATAVSMWLSNQLLIFICGGLLCEGICPIPAVYRPFLRWGFLGRMAGWFLYPGWASAVFYTGLIFVLRIATDLWWRGRPGHAISMSYAGLHYDPWVATVTLVVEFGAIIFPVALLRIFRPKTRHPVAGYFIIQAGAVVLFSIGAIVHEVSKDDGFQSLVDFVPTCGAMSAWFGGIGSNDRYLERLMPPAVVTLVSLGLLILLPMRRAWAEIRATERLALEPGKAPEPAAP
jgi:ABC-type transport system involved in multi-copper enzyme maturation permease subunit